jgi:hypothetical protein
MAGVAVERHLFIKLMDVGWHSFITILFIFIFNISALALASVQR